MEPSYCVLQFFYIPEEELAALCPKEYQSFLDALERNGIGLLYFAEFYRYASSNHSEKISQESFQGYSDLQKAVTACFWCDDFRPGFYYDCHWDLEIFYFRVSSTIVGNGSRLSRKSLESYKKLRQIVRYRELLVEIK